MKNTCFLLKILTAVLSGTLLMTCFSCKEASGDVPGKSSAPSSVPTVQDNSVYPLSGDVPALSPAIRYIGRFYTVEDACYFNMSCAGFEVNFESKGESSELIAEFRSEPVDSDHNTYIHIFIDDDYTDLDNMKANGTSKGLKNDCRIMLEPGISTITLAKGLPAGKHKVSVYKTNQSGLNKLALIKLTSVDGSLWQAPQRKEKSILAIGDSITCGCSNLGPDDVKGYTIHEDSMLTMAAMIARHYSSDIEVFARNGMNTNIMVDTLEKDLLYYTDPFNNKQDMWDTTDEARQPDLIIINLGTNDELLIQRSGGSYTLDMFRKDYMTLIKDTRAMYPLSYIICTDMSTLVADEEDVMNQYIAETSDKRISYHKRDPLYIRHPLITMHRVDADNMISFIDEKGIFND